MDGGLSGFEEYGSVSPQWRLARPSRGQTKTWNLFMYFTNTILNARNLLI